MYAALTELQLLGHPGQNYEYSNFGMGLLGHLLSLKVSQPYEDRVKAMICQPLGMTNTTIHLTPEQQQSLVPGYSADGTLTSNWDFDVMAPAGAFRSTAEDLLLFLQANLREADPQRAAVFARSQERHFNASEFLGLGLAWHIWTLKNGQVVHWHNGGTGGYMSFIGFDKVRQTGIVILSNYGDAFAGDNSVDEMAIRILMELSS
jgi:serine-type D-Ala-D-Ala carboxypeptidase/endopeptidase